MATKNPFRTAIMRKTFDETFYGYIRQSKLLYAYDTAGKCVGRAGNSWSGNFWAGYDGMTKGVRVPAKNTPAYAMYRAGQAAKLLQTTRTTNGQDRV